MTVGLFIPCYIDQFYPQVGRATLELLEKLDVKVEYPAEQTCCGQPMANTGGEMASLATYRHFVDTFSRYDYIVAPSGSCTHHVRHHYDVLPDSQALTHVRRQTYDLVEFLVDILKVESLPAYFPHRVGLHQSCHGLRGLRLGHGSERVGEDFSKLAYLLGLVEGVERVSLNRVDECCGFGGTFAITEPAVSVKMGKDRLRDHLSNGAEVLTAGDTSCLMHLEGLIRRQGLPLRVMHLAEILNQPAKTTVAS
ncbi:MAG: (Fe-S)-binding protein [Lewinella sp.]|nr:(Fe-S)-binding protein [Lewinella sp.]